VYLFLIILYKYMWTPFVAMLVREEAALNNRIRPIFTVDFRTLEAQSLVVCRRNSKLEVKVQ